MKLRSEHTLYSLKTLLFTTLFLFALLPFKVTHSLFIVYSLLVLFLFFKEKQIFRFRLFFSYALFTLPFLPYLIELLIYPHNKVIQFETEKKILFFIAPLIFYLDAQLKYKNQPAFAMTVFISAISSLSLVSLIYLFSQTNFLLAENNIELAYLLRQTFEEFSGLHPTYYGLFSSISILWILPGFNRYKNRHKIFLAICLFSLLLLNLLLASKMNILILFVGCTFLLFRKKEGKLKALLITCVVLLTSILCIFFIPSLNARFSEITSFTNHQTNDNTLVERNIIFNCNKSLGVENLYTGLGSRNSQAMLDYCYIWCGFNKGALIHLNSHNQFFTLLLNYGIAALLLFVLVLIYFIWKTRYSCMSNLFWISVCMIMLSESILERQMGIYYFLFFAALFFTMKNNDQEEPLMFLNPIKMKYPN